MCFNISVRLSWGAAVNQTGDRRINNASSRVRLALARIAVLPEGLEGEANGPRLFLAGFDWIVCCECAKLSSVGECETPWRARHALCQGSRALDGLRRGIKPAAGADAGNSDAKMEQGTSRVAISIPTHPRSAPTRRGACSRGLLEARRAGMQKGGTGDRCSALGPPLGAWEISPSFIVGPSSWVRHRGSGHWGRMSRCRHSIGSLAIKDCSHVAPGGRERSLQDFDRLRDADW